MAHSSTLSDFLPSAHPTSFDLSPGDIALGAGAVWQYAQQYPGFSAASWPLAAARPAPLGAPLPLGLWPPLQDAAPVPYRTPGPWAQALTAAAPPALRRSHSSADSNQNNPKLTEETAELQEMFNALRGTLGRLSQKLATQMPRMYTQAQVRGSFVRALMWLCAMSCATLNPALVVRSGFVWQPLDRLCAAASAA